MSTRSITKIYSEEKEILCIYKHWDGYPSGWGKDLAEYVSNITITDGIGLDDGEKIGELANGITDLAAQIITNFKTRVGDIYIYPIGSSNVGEEYEYHIYLKNNEIHIKCIDTWKKKTIYDGLPKDWSVEEE